MPERRFGTRAGRMKRVTLALLLAFLGTALFGQAATADTPKVPEDVAAYFATGLVPRLASLYGSPGSPDAESTFDETTKVGTIQRLLAWTPAFLAGHKTENPTELTNTWIAPVTAKSGLILGLAAVWINPGNNVVELADFSRGRALVDALGRAPKDTLLIDDMVQQAWFATDGKTLTPLVAGKSGADKPLTPAEYQTKLRAKAMPTTAPEAATNPGLVIAGVTLGAVVLLLAVFILLPSRRRKDAAGDAVAKPRRNPRDESDKAFDRQASRTEARATVRARAAVSAEAGLVDAMVSAGVRLAPTLVPEPAATTEGEPAVEAPPVRKPAARKPATRKPAAPKVADTAKTPNAPTSTVLPTKAPAKRVPAKSAAPRPATAGTAAAAKKQPVGKSPSKPVSGGTPKKPAAVPRKPAQKPKSSAQRETDS